MSAVNGRPSVGPACHAKGVAVVQDALFSFPFAKLSLAVQGRGEDGAQQHVLRFC